MRIARSKPLGQPLRVHGAPGSALKLRGYRADTRVVEIVPFLPLGAQAYLVVFAVGAAGIALWLHTRFPQLGPGDVRGVTMHLIASIAGANALVPIAYSLGSGSARALTATTIAVALPAVLYMFMSGIWVIRLGQGMLGRYSR